MRFRKTHRICQAALEWINYIERPEVDAAITNEDSLATIPA